MDIVLYLEQEVKLLGWEFSYGNKSNLNLLEADKDIDKIYFLCDIVEASDAEVSEYGGYGAIDYKVTFMLLVQSEFEDVYFSQRETETDDGKYNKNIIPLKTQLKKLKKVFDCSVYERRSWSVIDVVNQTDINGDGLSVSTTLRELE